MWNNDKSGLHTSVLKTTSAKDYSSNNAPNAYEGTHRSRARPNYPRTAETSTSKFRSEKRKTSTIKYNHSTRTAYKQKRLLFVIPTNRKPVNVHHAGISP
jgi:hypothetical protein